MASQPATGPLSGSTSPLEIGGSVTDGGAFAGLIDDVRVYNTALTAAQIQTDMTTAVGSAIDTQAPTAPTALVVTAVSTTQLSLSWAAATDNVGVTGYRLERCAGAGCTTSAPRPGDDDVLHRQPAGRVHQLHLSRAGDRCGGQSQQRVGVGERDHAHPAAAPGADGAQRADAGERRDRRGADADPQLGRLDECDAVRRGVRHRPIRPRWSRAARRRRPINRPR